MKLSPKLTVALVMMALLDAFACAKGTGMEVTGIDDLTPEKPKPPEEPSEPRGDSSIIIPPSSSPSSDDASTDAPSDGPISDLPDSSGSDCNTVAPSNACGLAPQCGCAENETCDITDAKTGAVACVPAGSGSLGSPCTKTTQCARGFTCTRGACHIYCAASSSCNGAGLGACVQLEDPPGTALPNAKVCTIECDLRDPAKQCGTNACVWNQAVKRTDCASAGTTDLRGACSKDSDCKQGLACGHSAIRGNECESWCRVGSVGDCASYQPCIDVFGGNGPLWNGSSKLGLCQ